MIPENKKEEITVEINRAIEMYPKFIEFLEKLEYMTLDKDMSLSIGHFLRTNGIW